MLNIPRHIVFIFIFLTILALFITLKSDPLKTNFHYLQTPTELTEIIKQKESWRQILRQTDSKLFYEKLKKTYQGNYNQHAVGHLFGDLLYEKEGIGGIEICDSNLYWGCYHAITSKAIVENGVEAIYKLDEVCKETSASSICAHGIGHGLSEHFGPDNLLVALRSCDDILGDKSCFTGVFMQYNFPTVPERGGSITSVRVLHKGEEYSPCGAFPEKYDESCYFELPRWWDTVIKSDFTKMGLLCSGIKNKKFEESCFFGIGDLVSLIPNPDVEKILSICHNMPSYIGENACLVSASLGFESDIYNKDKAVAVCQSASLEYQSQCSKK